MRLLVIDGNSIANRAFFGIKLLTTKDGRYTNAIYGFLNILLSLLKECQPDEVAVAFDLKAPTFRHKMYDGYKATRHGMPEELAQQMPVLKELLADLGYRTISAEGWEADDLLGTLAAACAVRQDEIGAVDERAERFVVQRLIGDLGVRGHGIAGLFARKDLFRARRGLVHRDIIKLQPHDIQFHVQAYLTNLEFIYHLSTYFRICPRNFGANFLPRSFTYARRCINCYESEA